MIETIKLHNGVSMPMEGFGVFQIPEADCEQVVTEAIKTGVPPDRYGQFLSE